jgi:transcriptional regulator with XRE-family HTH domain
VLEGEGAVDPAREDRGHHAVADRHARDAGADGNDLAGAVGHRDDVRADRQRVATAQDHQLAEAQRTGADAHERLGRARRGHRIVAQREGVDAAAQLRVEAAHDGRDGDRWCRGHAPDRRHAPAVRQFLRRYGRASLRRLRSAHVSTTAATSGFHGQLRRWRTARRVSQLELALRAGTTQRHVSYIEQGRSRPGRTMVARLAESLELPLRERNALLLAAGFAPAFPESPMDAEALGPIRAALEQVLVGHLPYPALVAARQGTSSPPTPPSSCWPRARPTSCCGRR